MIEMQCTESQNNYEQLLTHFQMIELVFFSHLLTKRNCTLALMESLKRCQIIFKVEAGENLECEPIILQHHLNDSKSIDFTTYLAMKRILNSRLFDSKNSNRPKLPHLTRVT